MAKLKYLLFYYILISFLFQVSLTDDIPSFSPEQPYTNLYTNIESKQYITLKFIKTDNFIYYLHFSTSPSTSTSLDAQQIIFSSESEMPSINKTEEYSFKFSSKANLITLDPNKTDNTVYLTIRCLEYPCSFNFKAALEINTANLYLNETHNFYAYNSNSIGKNKINKIKFYIPTMNNTEKNLMNIAVINPGDTDGSYNNLFYVKNTKETLIKKRIKIDNGVIYTIEKDENCDNYYLYIESMENQFIIISIKTSTVINKENIETDLTPNTMAKYTNIICEIKINECFQINKDYIDNFLKDSQENDFLYASINFLSLPIKTYLKYSNNQTELINNDIKNSLNVLLKKKENGEHPSICFEQTNKTNLKNNTLMIEISHLYQSMKNIDISSPIFSGFFIAKTLPNNMLGIYTHYSDIHFIEKISFYLKPTKGKPIMYFVQCNDYPNCIRNIDDLKKDIENVFKAQDFGDFQFYSKEYDPKQKYKDLAPYGNSQNLLYVYCPENNNEEYCQFEILTYSDLEEIIINENEEFNAVMKEDEKLMFRIIFRKGHNDVDNIEFCLNATDDDVSFDTLEDINNALVDHSLKEGMNCYIYKPDKKVHNLKENDMELIFNIIAKKDIQFKLINKQNVLYPQEIGKIIKIDDLSFPYSIYYLINNTESDFLFNLYLNSKNQDLNFDNIRIGAILLNMTYLTKIIKEGSDKILDGSIIGKIDPATRTVSLLIEKDYIKNIIKSNLTDKYYLHIVFENNDKISNDNIKANAKMFLLEKQKNNYYIAEKSNFITDNLILNNPNISNAYQFKMENNAILEIKFSSNYQIGDKVSLYIAEYKNEKIDINFLEKNKKEFEMNSIGQMYTILYNNSQPTDTNMIFAVVSKLQKDEIGLNKINYIFKYDLYKSTDNYNAKPKYDFNQNYTLTKIEDGYIFELDTIKRDNIKLSPEIYIRNITQENKILNETFDTYAKIESKYKLIKGEIKEDNGKTNITVNEKSISNFTFSIILDIPEENEKFVIFNLVEKFTPKPDPTPDPPDSSSSPPSSQDPEPSSNKSLAIKIAVPIACVVFVIIVVLVIITIRKRKGVSNMDSFPSNSDGLLKDELE